MQWFALRKRDPVIERQLALRWLDATPDAAMPVTLVDRLSLAGVIFPRRFLRFFGIETEAGLVPTRIQPMGPGFIPVGRATQKQSLGGMGRFRAPTSTQSSSPEI
jgi:hypothetical protein